MMMAEHRVVITGLGAITPLGLNVNDFFSGLSEGKNGISRITGFDVSEYRSKLGAEIRNFREEDWVDKKAAKTMDRFTQFAIAASEMAVEDAGLKSFSFNRHRAGVIIGSGIGGSQTIEEGYSVLREKGPKSMNPFYLSRLLINMAASMVSIKYGFMGPLSSLSVACSTGSNAIGDALRIIQRGDADIMIAGSSEAAINPLPYGCFCATRSMTTSDDPETASRPFDRDRDGFVMGEGAGIVILENKDHALQRKAKIYAEIAGYGNTADAYHFTAPEPEGDGMMRVMQAAIKDAKLDKNDIGYINAHGTSTLLNDKCESQAIRKIFGDYADALKISSNKSMIGHLLAAAGAVEFVATVMSLYTGIIPPTINYQTPDPDCPLDYVTNGAEKADLRAAMSNSFGFGGGNASLVIKKFGGIHDHS
jgi:3-oxoacyl-[acyl-carrier-protein] synthase II